VLALVFGGISTHKNNTDSLEKGRSGTRIRDEGKALEIAPEHQILMV
jgi:hypothetical protein